MNITTIQDLLNDERKMILNGERDYEEYFINTSNCNKLFNSFIQISNLNNFLFEQWFVYIRNHNLLAIFSATSRHHVQAMMNLRQVIESGIFAAYAIKSPNENFQDKNSKKIKEKIYNWIEEDHQNYSTDLKFIKKHINKTSAHANFISTYKTYNLNKKEKKINTHFFDFKNEFNIKLDLLFIAKSNLILMSLFHLVNKKNNSIKFIDDFKSKLEILEKNNLKLFKILKSKKTI